MNDFYFAVGSDPCDVFIVVNGEWVLYKKCPSPEIAERIVNGQNESRCAGKPNLSEIPNS